MNVFGLQLNVSDIKKGLDFYVDVLGFEVENESYMPTLIHLRKDSFRVILFKNDDIKVGRVGNPSVIIDIITENLEEEINYLKKNNVYFVFDEPVNLGDVAKYVQIQDPFGNALEIVEVK